MSEGKTYSDTLFSNRSMTATEDRERLYLVPSGKTVKQAISELVLNYPYLRRQFWTIYQPGTPDFDGSLCSVYAFYAGSTEEEWNRHMAFEWPGVRNQ